MKSNIKYLCYVAALWAAILSMIGFRYCDKIQIFLRKI